MRLTLLFLIVFLACSTKESSDRKLVWADEFEYTGSPDTTKWSYDLGNGCPNNCYWGNQELEYYTNDLKNVRVDSGKLIIEARLDSMGGMRYTSSRIVSRKKGDWLYGRIEVKAKLPRGRGTWPAIWMLPTDWKYGGWPASGEIDIMEHVGHHPGFIHFNIHTKTYNHVKKTQREGIAEIPDVQDTFHIYAIDWTEDKVDFYVDDKIYHTTPHNKGDTFAEWPLDQRFHILMNIAVGGGWGGMKGVDDSIWPQRMEVDYVRVYQ